MYNKYLKKIELPNKIIVTTEVQIPPNSPIIEFRGDVFTDEELINLKDRINIDSVLQVGPNIYIGPSGGIDDYINHSCNPNCVVKASGRRAILYSLYLINADSEITFDYSSTSTDDLDSWHMKCNCGQHNCRKIISGFHLLDKDLQEKYKQTNVAPLFIRQNIFRKI